jgi:hypothetical protein
MPIAFAGFMCVCQLLNRQKKVNPYGNKLKIVRIIVEGGNGRS